MGAMPDEPRQKMINVMYLVLTAILALNVSNEVITAFKVVDKSLITSNKVIEEGNETIYKSLEEKLNQPESAAKAKIWEPKAQQAKQLSAEVYNYIDSLKLVLKEEAGLRKNPDGTIWIGPDGEEDFRQDNLDASTKLFDTKGLGKELKQRLDNYKTAMMAIDPEIKKQFENNFPVNTDTKDFKSRDGKPKNFTETYFYMTPTVAALTVLSKFQNNIRNAENEVVTYAHSQIGAVKVIYDEFSALVGQSSNYVMPGEKISITAGVGAYSSAAKPSVTIGGSAVPVGADGKAEYTITAAGSGSHSVPVTVTYTKPDGTTESKSFPLQYTVGTPGGSAIMLDKMNVFYRGLDNPITISSGTGWDKTKVTMAGGNLVPDGGNGHYKVKVNTIGNASITVDADGKTSKFDFRVKDVPDPVLMVGSKESGRIPSVEFKNQRFARAELRDFIYDYNYEIKSATVYFSGAGFENVQSAQINSGSLAPVQQYLSRCMPGTSVTFDNVKVQGPGGPVKSIPGGGFILY